MSSKQTEIVALKDQIKTLQDCITICISEQKFIVQHITYLMTSPSFTKDSLLPIKAYVLSSMQTLNNTASKHQRAIKNGDMVVFDDWQYGNGRIGKVVEKAKIKHQFSDTLLPVYSVEIIHKNEKVIISNLLQSELTPV